MTNTKKVVGTTSEASDSALLFRTLYTHLGDDSNTQHYYIGRLVAKSGVSAKHRGYETLEGLIGFASERAVVNDEWHTYFAVCPRAANSMKSGVAAVPALWVDLDSPRWEELLKDIPLPPTMVVSSGKGAHAYWLLKEPVKPSDKVSDALTKLAIIGSGDEGAVDLTRLLRVPGTYNIKYDPPVLAILTKINGPEYTFEEIVALTFVGAKTLKRIRTGDARGYRTRSERDWSVVRDLVTAGMSDECIRLIFEQNPVGDKYREDPPAGGEHYLEHTLVKARASVGEKDSFGFQERDSGFWIEDSRGVRQVSTFLFSPKALLEPENPNAFDVLLGEVHTDEHTWEGVALTKEAFGGVRMLLKELPSASWQWIGTDREVRLLLPYLMGRLSALPGGAVCMKAVQAVGRHGSLWVAPGAIISRFGLTTPEAAGIMYLPTGRETPDVEYTILGKEEYTVLLKEFAALIVAVNEPSVIWPALGWAHATYYKPWLEACGIRFPILNLYGTRGSGKTSTAVDLLLPICGYVKPVGYDCSTTAFVLLSLLASTNAVPVAFSEFRRSSMSEASYGLFTRLLLLLYDVGLEARGRSNQTTVSYPLTAPVVIDGEDPLRDPAIMERTIPLRMRPEFITEGAKSTVVFKALAQLPLHKLAGKFVQYTLGNEPPIAKLRDLLFATFPGALPNRVRSNLLVSLVGLHAMLEFWKENGVKASVPKLTQDFVREIFRPVLVDLLGESFVRTRVLADEFVEDVVNAASTATRAFSYRYDESKSILWVHLSTALAWWFASRKRQGLSVLNRRAIAGQLEERLQKEEDYDIGQYVVARKRVSIGGTTVWAFGVSLEEAAKFGLDTPLEMSVTTVTIKLVDREFLE